MDVIKDQQKGYQEQFINSRGTNRQRPEKVALENKVRAYNAKTKSLSQVEERHCTYDDRNQSWEKQVMMVEASKSFEFQKCINAYDEL